MPGRRAVALVALVALVAGGQAGTGRAADAGTTTVTLGESNSAAQRAALLEVFGVEAGIEPITVTVEDTKEAMTGIFEMNIDSAYSSTALACRDLGDGLDVTTRNIEGVTPALYAMALVTAGIGDATLVVAAPDNVAEVRGMTALTGVFKT